MLLAFGAGFPPWEVLELGTSSFGTGAGPKKKKKKKKTSFDIEFTDGAIATLRIPPKLRLKIKNEHLGVRILAYDHRQYKSMS